MTPPHPAAPRSVPPRAAEPRHDPVPERVDEATIRRRQRARAQVMALLLGAFVLLVFLIAIAKIRQGMAH